ncbi:MAG TPA: glycosyltransferase [bacterium]|nr:glycosyltransferase [bacterium]
MRLAILSCNYGGGHKRVAETVAAEWEARTGGHAEIVDYFARFVHPIFDALTKFSYIQSVRHAPMLYGLFYKLTGEIRPDSATQRFINRMGMDRLERFLVAESPDAVCCVHCTPAGTMSDLRLAGRTSVPCLTVITDYVTHSQWIHPGVDRYCVPNDEVREGLQSRGVPADRLVVSGLPVERKFLRPLDREALRRQYGLRPDVPVVLVMAGAYAMLGGILDVTRALAQFSRPIQVLVVCGYDRRLEDQVRARAAGSPHPFHVVGYVDTVEELMTVSDVLVTKAGGVTVSEALVKRLPMLIYRPIPGQEEGNTRFLLEHGAAAAPRTPDALVAHLERLLGDPARLAAMTEAAASLGRPGAAEEVTAQLAGLPSLRQAPAATSLTIPLPAR